MVDPSLKYFVSCALGVAFDVSWFPTCLLLAYLAKILVNFETFEPSAVFLAGEEQRLLLE